MPRHGIPGEIAVRHTLPAIAPVPARHSRPYARSSVMRIDGFPYAIRWSTLR